MTSKKTSPKYKSKSNSLKHSLKILAGGENQNNPSNNADNNDKEKSSGLFTFLGRFKTEKPKDYDAKNEPDMDIDQDKNKEDDKSITFKSNQLVSALSPSEEASVSSTSPSSTGWFLFRVVIVLLVVLGFALNLTGHLDSVLERVKELFYKHVAPILISIGIMKPTPVIDSRRDEIPGSKSKTGTNTINQLDSNVGTKPVTTTPTTTTSPTPSTPPDSITSSTTKVKVPYTPPSSSNVSSNMQTRYDPYIKPIPIQPDERRTPYVNKGDSFRPPASAPAPYNEVKSREMEKKESIKKALEYALKNQKAAKETKGLIPRPNPGYCYIGEDRGFRSCIKVTPDMKCMSGDIFPTMDVCVNPRLRV